jgi:hypothetical protein
MKANKTPALTQLGSLQELNELLGSINIIIATPKGPRTLAGRKLTPAEEARIRELGAVIRPPLIDVPMENNQTARGHDYENAEYQAKMRMAYRQMRALAVYLGVPMFKAAFDEKKITTADNANLEILTEWIEEQSTAAILDTIQAQVVSNSEEQTHALADFFSRAASPAS